MSALLKLFCILLCLCIIVSCDTIETTSSEKDILAKRFLGKTFCIKETLFIWQFFEDEISHFKHREFLLRKPLKEEKSISEHIALAEKYRSYRPKAFALDINTKLTISEILYRKVYIYDGSGYIVLAEINNKLFKNKLVDIGWLFLPLAPLKSDAKKAVVNGKYLAECEG